MSGRRARARRKERRERHAERELLVGQKSDRLDQLRRDRDKKLGKLTTEYDRKLKALLVEHAVARGEIWKDYDDRRETMLRAKKRAAA